MSLGGGRGIIDLMTTTAGPSCGRSTLPSVRTCTPRLASDHPSSTKCGTLSAIASA